LSAVGRNQYTLKQLMDKLKLKHCPNFIENYIDPAINNGYFCLLYPDSPHHSRQKHLLTVKGLAMYNIGR
jgi:hypothetical protein